MTLRTFSLLSCLLSCVVLFGCGGAQNAQALDRGERDEISERDILNVWNEQARAGAVSEVLHGVTIDDPFRALEADNAATQQWINGQSRRTQWALSQIALPGAQERLSQLLSIATIEHPTLGGEDIFYLSRKPGHERSALYRRTPDGNETLIANPTQWGERAAIDWYFASPDGSHVAFGVSQNGDERSTLRVFDVRNGRVLGDTIERTKWTSVTWLHDHSGFYYTRYPAPGEPDYDADNPESYFPRLYFHTLGQEVTRDVLVWGAPNPTDFPSLSLSEDDRYALIHNFRGWTASDVYLFDRGAITASSTNAAGAGNARAIAPDEQHPLRTVIAGVDALSSGQVHRGHIYLNTNLDAPHGRIVRVDLAHAEDTKRWQSLLAEPSGSIEEWSLTRNALVVHRVDDVRSHLHVQPLSAGDASAPAATRVALPTIGAIDGLDADPRGDRILFSFSSYFVPPTLQMLRDSERASQTVMRVQSDFDVSAYELSQEHVTSADGTQVNVYLMHRRGLLRDGNNPVLLYGYGGFNVSLLPAFSRTALYWLERGGVYAVATLRGGGELGEAWHRAGMREHKHHVFEDFEAVIAWLSSSKLSRPGRIAISGGSNGGLLMGAVLTRVPEKVGAVIASVGLYDMVRYTKFPPAALWISEYGDPDVADDLAFLHAYSPYHQVRAGVDYPFTLIETADHDTRVHWAHSTKLTARMQQAAHDPTRIYFYMERSLGHGRGTSLADQVARQLRAQAFLTRALGL